MIYKSNEKSLVNAYAHSSDVVSVNELSTITVGELNQLILCNPLSNFGVLKVHLVADFHELIDPFLTSFVSYFKDKATCVLVQHVGLDSAIVSLVYSTSCCRLFYYLHKFEPESGCKLIF